MRAISREAGPLLVAATLAAALIIVLALIANTRAPDVAPAVAPFLWAIVALGVFQIVGALLIWRVVATAGRRFAERLQAATGSLGDRIFLAAPDGSLKAVFDRTGWTSQPPRDWTDAVHPEDRASWPVEDARESQRVELRLKDADGEWRWHRLRATPLLGDDGSVEEWVGTLHDIHDQKRASEHREFMIGELRHRLKNLLTVIDALAKNSRKPDAVEPGVDQFLKRYLGRLHALGMAGDIFLAANREGVDVVTLFETTLAPFTNETASRVAIAGPAIFLSEESAANFGLAIHELATNALKYGALSVPEGRITLTWTVEPEGEGERVTVSWKERGGPPPRAPAKPGFGMRMIKHVASREKHGRVDIDYPEDGLECRIVFERDGTAGDGSAP